VSALEDFGYVRRDADPRDARASTLAITPGGHEMLETLRQEGTALLTESLTRLTEEQLSVLGAALPVLEQLADTDLPKN
jgi:DNA-binding MarR family transcriptional regulator